MAFSLPFQSETILLLLNGLFDELWDHFLSRFRRGRLRQRLGVLAKVPMQTRDFSRSRIDCVAKDEAVESALVGIGDRHHRTAGKTDIAAGYDNRMD